MQTNFLDYLAAEIQRLDDSAEDAKRKGKPMVMAAIASEWFAVADAYDAWERAFSPSLRPLASVA